MDLSITHAHQGSQRGLANNVKAKSILTYSGWISAAQEMIVKCTNNCKILKNASNIKIVNPEFYANVQEDVKEEPKKYQKYSLPLAWFHFFVLRVLAEAPMHLLMLGIVKSVLLQISTWLRYQSQKTLFLGMAKVKLLSIKTMSIEWCKVLEYPVNNKFDGWISENFLALIWLSNWFYSLLEY